MVFGGEHRRRRWAGQLGTHNDVGLQPRLRRWTSGVKHALG